MQRTFEFTDAQEQDLRRWAERAASGSKENPDWRNGQLAATAAFKALLDQTAFEKGTDLTADQLDVSISLAKKVVRNQWLNRTVYEATGAQTFNARLRALLFGREPLFRRAGAFLEMAGVGAQTASQFLCLLDPATHAVVTWNTWRPLKLSEEQQDAASQDALTLGQISNAATLSTKTAKFMQRSYVGQRIKELLGLSDFYQVNAALWAGHKEEQVGSDQSGDSEGTPTEEADSVGLLLEKDLRDWIATHPTCLGPGLKLHDPDIPIEYPSGDGGSIDVLLEDPKGTLVVVEAKRAGSSRRVVGQILGYMGSLMKAGHKRVRGIIVMNEDDEGDVATALLAVPNVDLVCYAVRFEFKRTPIDR